MTLEDAVETVTAVVKECYYEAKIEASVSESTPLVGGDSLLDSMGLVQICLALEDKAEEIGFDFDWTSDAAMSKSKGMYRTVTALAEEFQNQQKNVA
jgi:acyl carrier protein